MGGASQAAPALGLQGAAPPPPHAACLGAAELSSLWSVVCGSGARITADRRQGHSPWASVSHAVPHATPEHRPPAQAHP